MKITVTVDGNLLDRLRRGGERAEGLMLGGLDRLGDEFVTQARAMAGSGRFGQSFSSKRDGRRAVIAGSTSPLASIIEKGRKPGRRPPVIKGRITPEAATRIAQSGTKGTFIVKKAATKLRRDGTAARVARDVVERVAEG